VLEPHFRSQFVACKLRPVNFGFSDPSALLRACPESIEGTGFGFLILLKKFDSKKQKKFFAHKWPITNDRRLVNDFLHPEFSWMGGFSAESIVMSDLVAPTKNGAGESHALRRPAQRA
jgi:hypothetical protein